MVGMSVTTMRGRKPCVKLSESDRASPRRLTRNSHKVATAAADLLVLTAFRSVGLLDVLSSTTAMALVARPCQDGISTASLRNLVRNAG
jgi:hypothetical protein